MPIRLRKHGGTLDFAIVSTTATGLKTMYIGLDLGTTGIKAIACDDSQKILRSAEVRQTTQVPCRGQAEQSPQSWIDLCRQVLAQLIDDCPGLGSDLKAIGLSGQMHTLLALGTDNHPLRPAILWNDHRGDAFVAAMAERDDLIQPTGVGAMPSFTAAKLHWLRSHEPAVFDAIHRILLPKDFVRLWLTGSWHTDASDAAGSQLFDQDKRDWCRPMIDVLCLDPAVLPPILDGTEIAGTLRPSLARELGIPEVPVAVGGGDAATGALGVGCIDDRQSMISMGTGSLYLTSDTAWRALDDRSIHYFAHALPNHWFRMSTLLSCGSALEWVCRASGFESVTKAVGQLEARGWSGPGNVTALPHLDGRRGDRRSAAQRGVFAGLDRDVDRLDLVQSIMEGIAFALADADSALRSTGPLPEVPMVIGGGGGSALWMEMLATALDRPVDVVVGSGAGSALGAVRLAMIAMGASLDDVAVTPETRRHLPRGNLRDTMAERRGYWRELQDTM